jgi:hypothetical protein
MRNAGGWIFGGLIALAAGGAVGAPTKKGVPTGKAPAAKPAPDDDAGDGDAPAAPAAKLGPATVLRQSVWVEATTMHEDDWVPSVSLLLKGDLPEGAELAVEYTRPDGTAWGRAALDASEPDDAGVRRVRPTMLDAGTLSAKLEGTIKFAIVLGKQPLFRGQFKAVRLPPDVHKRVAYAIDHDWALPVGQLWLDADQHPDNPSLVVAAWFARHGVGCQDVDATVRFEGKDVASTTDGSTTEKSSSQSLRATDDRDGQRYVQCRFVFQQVKGYVNGSYADAASWHQLAKRPGRYEVRLTSGGQPDRVMAFTVDKAGQVVRTGPVEPSYRSTRMLILAGDGKAGWDDAKNPAAFYGSRDLAVDLGVAAMYAAWKRK